MAEAARSYPMLSTGKSGWQPQKFRFWYDAIIDWMLANPGGSHKDCAKALGRNHITINHIVASDMFKARYAERRGELNTMYSEAILLKTSKVALQALDVLSDKLENSPKAIPAATVADIASKSMEALGFGAPRVGQAMPTQEVHVHVGGDILAAARERMRTIEQQKLAEGPLLESPEGRASPTISPTVMRIESLEDED